MISRKNMGFTLSELLTVISVIAVLAAILMPIFTSAKASAKRTSCQSNLTQIARGFEAYLSDYESCYPNTNDPYLWQGRVWRWPVRKYIGFYAAYNPNDPSGAKQATGLRNNVLACPMDTSAQYDKTSYTYSASFYHTPEQINTIVNRNQLLDKSISPECAVMQTSNVKWPSKKIMVCEWACYHSSVPSATLWDWRGERNWLFADGHVVYLSTSKIHPANDKDASGNPYPDINVTKDGVAGKDID